MKTVQVHNTVFCRFAATKLGSQMWFTTGKMALLWLQKGKE
jgi:hypothetical protein